MNGKSVGGMPPVPTLNGLLTWAVGVLAAEMALVVISLRPTFRYVNDVRTDEVIGTSLGCAVPGSTWWVKVAGKGPDELGIEPGDVVEFEGLQARAYVLNGQRDVRMSLKASSVSKVERG